MDIDEYRCILKRSLEFRTLLLKISKNISNQQCKELWFLYGLGPRRDNFIEPLDLFAELIQNCCVQNHEGLLEYFGASLKTVGREDLSKIVAEYIREHHNNFPFQGPVQECSRITYSSQKFQADYQDSQPPKVLMNQYDSVDDQSECRRGHGQLLPEPSCIATQAKEDLHKNSEDEEHMKSAERAAEDSTDPATKVGAVIIGADREVIAKGCNCMPNGCEGKLPWDRTGQSETDTKYPFVVHAIENGIIAALMGKKSLTGATVYTTLFPGHLDAKLMIQCGIKRLFYLDDKYMQKNHAKAAKKLFDTANIEYRQCVPCLDDHEPTQKE